MVPLCKQIIVSATKPTGRGKVWMQHSNNLFVNNIENQTLNGITVTKNTDGSVTLDGTATANTVIYFNNKRTDIQNKSLYLDSHLDNSIAGFLFSYYVYNSDGSYKENLNDKNSVILSNGAYLDNSNLYITNGTTLNNITIYPQLTKGSGVAEYEQYVENKILLLNDNNEYEEFSRNIVTGVEFSTGRMVDGKREFGKRVGCGALLNTNTKAVSHGLSNINILDFKGIAKTADGTTILLPYVAGNISWQVELNVTDTSILITSNDNKSNYIESYVTIYYTKN